MREAKKAVQSYGYISSIPSACLGYELKRDLGTVFSHPSFESVRILHVQDGSVSRKFAIELGDKYAPKDNIVYSPGIIFGIQRRLSSSVAHSTYVYDAYLAPQDEVGTFIAAPTKKFLIETWFLIETPDTPHRFTGVSLFDTSEAYKYLLESTVKPTVVLCRGFDTLRTKYIREIREPNTLSDLAAIATAIEVFDTLAHFAELAARAESLDVDLQSQNLRG